ncbi:MAG: efflux RND transporter periplasmic adaptor subunit [Gemmataceae bacterium]
MFKRRCVLGLIFLSLLAALTGCGPHGPTIAELPPPAVTVSRPVVRAVVDHDEYEGRIAAVKTNDIRARVRGELVKVLFKDGQLVKAGDPLFEIDPRPYQAALDAATAQKAAADAAYELAQTELERTASLVRSNAAGREELDVRKAKRATTKADRLKADAEIYKAQLDLNFCKIAAPIGGRISRPLVTEGNLVNVGGGETLLTTIVSIDPVYVYFNVDERALLRYRREYGKANIPQGEDEIKELKIPVFVAIEGDADFSQKGILDFVENRVNRSTGTIPVRGVLENAKQLMDDGMRARVRVPVSDPYTALLINERAIGTDQGIKYLYVVNADNIVERRDIQPDRSFDGLTAIKSGLKATEWVIVNGIQRAREGTKVHPKQAPMPGEPAAAKNTKN